MYTIYALTPGDEVIGCFGLLLSGLIEKEQEFTVFYVGVFSPEQQREAERFAAHRGGKVMFGADMDYPVQRIQDRNTTVMVAPDPCGVKLAYHHHCGMSAWMVAKHIGKRFMAYSMKMTAPYVVKLPTGLRDSKRRTLDEFFPSRKQEWHDDRRLFLFEGMSEWMVP